MTKAEHKIRRAILLKLRVRIAEELDKTSKAYFLGLEAGHLLQGGTETDRRQLQANYEAARQIGVEVKLPNLPKIS